MFGHYFFFLNLFINRSRDLRKKEKKMLQQNIVFINYDHMIFTKLWFYGVKLFIFLRPRILLPQNLQISLGNYRKIFCSFFKKRSFPTIRLGSSVPSSAVTDCSDSWIRHVRIILSISILSWWFQKHAATMLKSVTAYSSIK